ncbi:exonuclease SbcCD subunit D [Cyanobium sp. ATX 6A2]|uniref:exonuclease SbcCD subunit D n=1 Tax=Cyanobium sp. ATX 6A2 TaxID=2823700 RepID=UPI0020CCAAFC|nr:exonuclease SbcCD subunit D [Cyanobium sp. ATX 6A2]MCP9887233.1 exonuclease SbcCD subunit D [Cyanobium sp. ATX 6A2]
MRLLHTSDWHLGRQFHGLSLLDEQARAMDRLVELAGEAAVDLVVIAGDLYDRAIPPADAVRLFTDTLARLRAGGAAVVAIAGNHDSHVRVSVYDELLAAQGVTIRGRWQRAAEPVLVTPRGGGAPVAVYPLPYLEPLLEGPALQLLAAATAAGQLEPQRPARVDHQLAMELALLPVRADLARRPGVRSVLVAHAFVAGGRSSESERDLSVGNAEAVAVPTFAGFNYVALGHLHGAQQLDGPRLAYSGTPLPYSFSEQDQVKSVRVVELDPQGSPTLEVVPLGVGRPLRTLTGPLEQLLSDPRLEEARGAWVRALLSDEQLPRQAMARLRQRFPHAVELRHQPPEQPRAGASERRQRILQAADPLQRTLAFFADQQGRPADGEEERLLRQALAQAAARRP